MLSGSRFYHCALLNLIFFHLGRFCFPAEIIFSGLTASVFFCSQQNVTGAHFYVVKKHHNFPEVARRGCKMLVKNVAV
ncbi:hypothetical protein FMK57_12765 [Klebsiella oxytoca]|jgi:hypothetical protein|nr:hypothetical protein [Klebsiella oxytoca]